MQGKDGWHWQSQRHALRLRDVDMTGGRKWYVRLRDNICSMWWLGQGWSKQERRSWNRLGLRLRVNVHQEDASKGVECKVGWSEACIQAQECTKETLTAQVTSRENESKDESSNLGEGQCSFAEGVGPYQNSDSRGKGEDEAGSGALTCAKVPILRAKL